MAELLDQPPIVFHPLPGMEMNDDDQFFQFCQANPELRIERAAGGDIIIMTPEGGSSGFGNAELHYIFETWARRDGTGRIADASTGFILPNGAMRAPDVAWVLKERLSKIPPHLWKKFLPICPDFVLELRSPSDSLRTLQAKMEEYIANGARLGWLIDPESRRVIVYKPAKKAVVLENPTTVKGDPVLRGFALDLPTLWQAMEPPSKKKTRAV